MTVGVPDLKTATLAWLKEDADLVALVGMNDGIPRISGRPDFRGKDTNPKGWPMPGNGVIIRAQGGSPDDGGLFMPNLGVHCLSSQSHVAMQIWGLAHRRLVEDGFIRKGALIYGMQLLIGPLDDEYPNTDYPDVYAVYKMLMYEGAVT